MAQTPVCDKIINMGEILKWFWRLSPFGAVHNIGKHIHNVFNPNNKKDTIISDVIKMFKGTYEPAKSISEVLSPLGNELDSLVNKYTEAGPTGRDKWIAAREDSTHQRNVADMLNAGLNPALMYGGGSAPSINTSSAGSGASLSDLMQMMLLPLQAKAMKADIKKTEADAKKTEVDTEGQELSNKWYEEIKRVEIDSKTASSNLDKAKISEVEQSISESKARISKMLVEEKELYQRIELEVSQMALNNANARNIVEMLPYEKMLAQAKTELSYSSSSTQLASAELAFANAAYQRGLIENGMIEFVCRKEGATAEIAAVEAALASPSYDSQYDSTFTKILRNLVSGVGNAIRIVSPIKSFSSVHVYK